MSDMQEPMVVPVEQGRLLQLEAFERDTMAVMRRVFNDETAAGRDRVMRVLQKGQSFEIMLALDRILDENDAAREHARECPCA